MKYKKLALLSALLSFGLMAPMETQAFEFFVRPSKVERQAAPLAYQLFCLKSPRDCRAGASGSIRLTAAKQAMLARINRQVNRSMRPVYDKGVDRWSADTRSGDCEDFALTKRRHLIKAGFPAGALRMAVARTGWGEGHAVLVVHTSTGDYVLDNRTDSIKTWRQTDLKLIKMASANPLRWN